MTPLITEEGLRRLDAALAWIDEHPEQHDQGNWIQRSSACGTAYCLAGVVVHLAGAEPVWYDNHVNSATDSVMHGGRQYTVARLAQQLLEVAYPERVALFDEENTKGELRIQRDRLAASLEGSQESTGAAE